MLGIDLKKTVLFPVAISMVICTCFMYLYAKFHPSTVTQIYPLILTKAAIGKPLPEMELIDSDHNLISGDVLKQEKAVIVVVSSKCTACATEISFLKNVVNQNPHVKFYGLLVYSDIDDLFTNKDKYPFKVLYDRTENLKSQFGIDRTPIKIFCDHGVIQKVWVGTTGIEPEQKKFTDWLGSIS